MASSKAKPTNGSWTVTAGVATWSAGTATPNPSYQLTVPTAATLFNVSTPATRTRQFTVRGRIDQLSEGADYSSFTGRAGSQDKFVVTDPSGVIGDALFTNFSSVEQLKLEGSQGLAVTLGSEAQSAGIKEVEGGNGNDSIDAQAYTMAIEIEGELGNDSLTGGSGNDEIEGGRGADQISLSAGGSDKVKYESRFDGSPVGTAGGSFSGYDVITGFSSGGDKIDIDFSAAAVEISSQAAGFDFTSVNDVLTAMNAAVSADAYLAGVTVIFAINDTTTSALYAAQIVDSDLVTAGIQPGASNPTMLATVDAVLVGSDII